MIRVLCVFSNLNRGGAETMCMNLYRKIDRTKIQFDFVKHTSEKCAFDDEIVSLGGKIYIAPRFKIYNILQYRKWWKKHLIEHPEHQIIHGHYFTISSVYFNVAHKLKRITVGHSHIAGSGINNSYSFKKTIKILIRKNVKNTADYRLACSQIAGNFLYGKKDFIVLNNAVDSSKFIYDSGIRIKKRNELNIADSQKVLCVVGRIEEQKNPIGTIDIFKKLYETDSNCRLLWVGDGTLRQNLEEKIRKEKMENQVALLGVRSDIPEILQAVDVFLLASYFEGLPVVGIEAQASGLPCLLSDGISKETAITDLCHFLPIDRPELWVEAISKLDFTNRKNTKEEIVAAGYDVETTAKWLQEFYTNIVKERNLSNE